MSPSDKVRPFPRSRQNKSGLSAVQRQIPKIPLELYPYQKRWIADSSRLKIATKARRIGFSFAAGLGSVLDALERKQNVIVLSRGERQAKEFIEESVAPHCRAIGEVSRYVQCYIPDTSIYSQRIEFGNGSSIIALPANPDTARSYEGDVVLDEFGFHQDARKIFEAIAPSITRGYKLSIISTPNGQQGEYYELAKRAGLVDSKPTDSTWSPHRVDIFEAIEQGFRDRDGKVLDAAVIRESCLDQEMWLQEYGCQFLSIASQWISPELFESCASAEATFGYPVGPYRELYAGWDVARNKDLSVIWLIERVGDISWTRGVIEMRNLSTPSQMDEARRLMPMIQRLVIDKGSMGLTIFEQLQREFGSYAVEGVNFTLTNKEAMAVAGKTRMEQRRVRLPDTAMIRNSFRSVKKTVTATGQARFDAEHDAQFGHADHWWAYCMAESAIGQTVDLGLVEYLKKLSSELDTERASRTSLQGSTSSQECPDCKSTLITKIPGEYICSSCGCQFGRTQLVQWGPSRRDILN